MHAVNIVTIVDTIAALSSGSLRNHVYMADDGWCSKRKGTAELATACYPGQPISWTVHAIDVQSPALISEIRILDLDPHGPAARFTPGAEAGGAPQWTYWSGLVPCCLPPGRYGYRLQFQLGRGERSVLTIDTPALNVLSWTGAQS